MPAMDGSPLPSVAVIQADTECAETLLALASSWHGATDSSLEGFPVIETAQNSLSSDESADQLNEILARRNEEKQYNREILKRVKLDHNYYWSGPIESRPALSPFPTKARKISENDSSVKHGKELYDCDVISSPQHSPDSGISDLSPVQPEAKQSDCNELNSVSYSNLQILLQCIVDREKMDVEDSAYVKQDGDDDDDNGADSDGGALGGRMVKYSSLDRPSSEGHQKYVCHKCSRHFTKKRYLTKHVRRMHPEVGLKQQASVCMSCGTKLTRQNFLKDCVMCVSCAKKSRNKMSENDVVTCQHCGVRLRRHILVKHLAQEHCVDRLTSCDVDDFDLCVLFCHLCTIPLRKDQVKSHFLEKHLCKEADKGWHLDCQLCGEELVDSTLSAHLITEHCRKETLKQNCTKTTPLSKSTAITRKELISKLDLEDSPKIDEIDEHFFRPSSSTPLNASHSDTTQTGLIENNGVVTKLSPSKEGRTNRHFIVKKAEASAVKESMDEKQSVRHSISTVSPAINKNAMLIQPLSY